MTKKHITISIFIAVLAGGVNAGCDDASNSEGTNDSLPECQSYVDTWKCDGNTLSKCIAGKWELIQTCENNTQCNVEKKSCVPDDTPECTNDTWKCDGNILSKCIYEKWELIQTCEDNSQCNAETKACTPVDKPECTNDTWKCDGNILSKCVSGNWETGKTCEESAKCNAEKGTCDIECKDTEHFFAERCEVDDVTHCGTHTNDCTTMSGVKSASCIGKKCFAEDCATGYHLNSIFDSDGKERTICEEDTHDACGSINHQCGAVEICTQGKCKNTCLPGEVVCGGSCINPNTSTKFCGADTSCSSFIPCSEFEDCVDGKCILTSCPNAEESICTTNEQNLCVDIHGNNPNHCGACGAACTDKGTVIASGCNHGQCTYTCDDGMVNCGSETEPLCLPKDQLQSDSLHCGKCDTKCESNEFCKEGQCIVNTCTSNECLLDNVCINQNEHCGTQCLNCNKANHASTGICQSGSCVITACATGYHLTDKGECEVDSATACPNGETTGTVNCNTLDYTKTGICEEGVCKATSCQANAHIKDNLCVADTIKTCGSETNDCTQLAGWKTGDCENAKCVAKTCQSGFCLNSLQKQCTNAQSSTTCGIDGNACQSCTIKQICSAGMCADKKCNDTVCQQTTGANEEDLCQNDTTHCGSDCQNCNTFTSHATAGICTTVGTCQVTACEPGFHIYNNACEADSTTNCGGHSTQCNVANATNTCTNGACTFTCDSGYHTYDSACEANSTTHCGAHGKACVTGQTCNAGNCVESVNIGDIITFGHYEQDNDLTNGKEPIEWRILFNSGGHLLVISDKVLDKQQYNTTRTSITWERSTIRSWLNGYDSSYNTVGNDYTSNNFIDTAFTAEEKAKILASTVLPHLNPSGHRPDPGNATTDKIFLLSILEANHYFATDTDRKAYATLYAVNNGLNSVNYDSKKTCTTSNFQENKCSANWWLRSPSTSSTYDNTGAEYVSDDGRCNTYYVNTARGIRPAMWVNY